MDLGQTQQLVQGGYYDVDYAIRYVMVYLLAREFATPASLQVPHMWYLYRL